MSTISTAIDYNKVREMLGVVITDGYYDYVVADYKMGCDAYQLWCKSRQTFYYTGYNALHQLFEVISG
jgi:regulation of enolase protein 1 (concanavalin A-like superfamily)